MANPIQKVWLSRNTEAWYQLSQEEQNNLLQKVVDALAQVGGKTITICDGSWSSEEWQAFGVEEYPDIEAVQKHTALLNELNWFRYIESITVLGSALQM
jgi:hypothetical protein